MNKNILRIKNGNVELMNISGQRVKTYYNKGDAIRVDWFDEAKGSVQVQLKSGKVIFINVSGQIFKTIY
jgi:hypothetical protein